MRKPNADRFVAAIPEAQIGREATGLMSGPGQLRKFCCAVANVEKG
jgi:hypothetical protein